MKPAGRLIRGGPRLYDRLRFRSTGASHCQNLAGFQIGFASFSISFAPFRSAERASHLRADSKRNHSTNTETKTNLASYGVLLTAGVALFGVSLPLTPPDKKPNIIIIWGDDVGQSDISAYSMGLMGFPQNL